MCCTRPPKKAMSAFPEDGCWSNVEKLLEIPRTILEQALVRQVAEQRLVMEKLPPEIGGDLRR